MFFSIIIPVYNVEKYLSECIGSVLKQTFTDYELILVDDGSEDRSGLICDEYAKQYQQIRVIHKMNSGAADSRNVGTNDARGEYIIYIDSDDYIISKNFFKDIHDEAQIKKSDLILYKFQKFNDGEQKLKLCTFSLKNIVNKQKTDEILLSLVKEDAFFASPWSKAIRREIITKSGIYFEKELVGEDNEWYLHLLSSCNCTISVIDKSYIAYRQRNGSTSRISKLKGVIDSVYVLEKWSEGIAAANITSKRKEALNGAMAKYYAHLLIGYARNKDPKKIEYKQRIKELHTLLKYGKSRRPILIKKVYSVIGFSGTIFLLKILDKVKV